MDVNIIKEIRDTFQGVPGVIIKIFLDNDVIFHQNLKGQVVIWNDSKEKITCIRENTALIEVPQHIKPWEIIVAPYECIQNISILADINDIEKYLTAISYSKKDKLIEYLSSQKVAKSSITGSTGDGFDLRVGTKKEEDKG